MVSVALYIACVLIWGSTWYAIKLQLGPVAPEWSVAYRFLLAGLLLIAVCLATGKRLRFRLADHGAFLVLGALLFSINYVLVYWAAEYLTSGLIAVAFSMLTIFNIVNGAIFLRQPLEAPVIIGALIGLAGIALVFLPDLQATEFNRAVLFGVMLALVAPFVASLGNTMAAWAQTRPYSMFSLNAWSMLYGGMLTAAFSFVSGKPVAIGMTPEYLGSLVYLSVIGSILAFMLYFALIRRVGLGRAGYITILFPLVALVISDFLEDFDWTTTSLTGMAMVVAGNGFLIRRRQVIRAKQAPAKAAE